MRLPNLSALRLAGADRGAATDVWVRYELPEGAKKPNEKGEYAEDDELNDDPDHYDGIHQDRFYHGQWIWKTKDNQGRVRYDPRSYWRWLDGEGQGKDPFSREPIPKSELEELLEGPPEDKADRSRDRVQLAEPREADTILERWQNRRSGNAGATPAQGQPAFPGQPEFENEEDQLQRALETPFLSATWDQWMRQLIYRGLTRAELSSVFQTSEREQLIRNLGLSRSMMQVVEMATDAYNATRPPNRRPLRWHMPFYTTGFQHLSTDLSLHRSGVTYQWGHYGLGLIDEVFTASAWINRESQLSRAMNAQLQAIEVDPDRLIAPFSTELYRKVVLRSLIGLPRDSNIDFLDQLDQFLSRLEGWGAEQFTLRVMYMASVGGEDAQLYITISPQFMAWLCRDEWVHSRPTELPPNTLPLPPHASLATAFATPNTREWSNAQSELLWKRALDKMSRAMSAVVEDALRSQAPENTFIHLPSRPFEDDEPIIAWAPRDDPAPTDAYTLAVRSKEIFWYGAPNDEMGNW